MNILSVPQMWMNCSWSISTVSGWSATSLCHQKERVQFCHSNWVCVIATVCCTSCACGNCSRFLRKNMLSSCKKTRNGDVSRRELVFVWLSSLTTTACPSRTLVQELHMLSLRSVLLRRSSKTCCRRLFCFSAASQQLPSARFTSCDVACSCSSCVVLMVFNELSFTTSSREVYAFVPAFVLRETACGNRCLSTSCQLCDFTSWRTRCGCFVLAVASGVHTANAFESLEFQLDPEGIPCWVLWSMSTSRHVSRVW